jgi:hypothetical protein
MAAMLGGHVWLGQFSRENAKCHAFFLFAVGFNTPPLAAVRVMFGKQKNGSKPRN